MTFVSLYFRRKDESWETFKKKMLKIVKVTNVHIKTSNINKKVSKIEVFSPIIRRNYFYQFDTYNLTCFFCTQRKSKLFLKKL